MSTFRVTAEPLMIHPHPNADALELAQVGLYRAVVAKGAYSTGDFALYIPEQAVLPPALIEELGLTGRLGGKQHNRVTPVRLRGELSQGLVCRPAALDGVDLKIAYVDGVDFAEQLGITKWAPPIPAELAGEVEPDPDADLLPWIDIENIKRYPNVFAVGEPVIATEKVHGTALLLTYVHATGRTVVSSKGIARRGLTLTRSSTNLYWRAVTAYELGDLALYVAENYGADRVGIFGEVYGQGVQDLHYGANAGITPGFVLFDIAVDVDGEVRWLTREEITPFATEHEGNGDFPLRIVPALYEGPYDEAVLLALAEGVESLSGTQANIREGLVVRPVVERHSDAVHGRAILKVVSEAYLTRKGGTEYE